jgi:hypothetical protein
MAQGSKTAPSLSPCRGRLRGAAPLFLSLLVATGLMAGQTQKKSSPPKKKAAKPAVVVPAAVPFSAGEHLEYAAQWNRFVTAATLRMEVRERRDFYGRSTWHFQASARTIDPVRMIYTLDDQFDSYTDAGALESLQYEAYIREQKKEEDLVVPMASRPPAVRGNAHVYLVLPGTQDPLGLMYSLRAHDWTKEPAAQFPVFDGRNLYEVQAHRESVGAAVTVAAGNFVTTRISLRILRGGTEVPNLKLWVNLTEDASRVPVLIEAEAPFGTVRAELTVK